MNIFTVNLKPKVLEYDNGKVKIYVDYPNIEQGQELKRVLYQDVDFNLPVKEKDGKETFDLDNLSFEKLGIIFNAEYQLKLLRIKYCIKGWEGITDENGNPFECKIENNELARDVFVKIVVSDWIDLVYKDMIELLRFNETDKKKLVSSGDSDSKED